MSPLLSVIIPCYNAGEYIRQMLECCLCQTFRDWEVIVVDDGSTDGVTKSILKTMSERDCRIIYINRARLPKGGDTCRNIGFGKSRGKYIIFFDADDLISYDCFSRRISFMEENSDCDYATFPAAYFNNCAKLPDEVDAYGRIGVKKGHHDELYYLLTYNYPFTVWTNIYRKAAIANVLWDENVLVMQDFDWMLNCALSGLKHKYCKTDRFDYYYRQFNDGHNVCGNFFDGEKQKSTLYLFEKVLIELSKRTDKNIRLKEFFVYVTAMLNRMLVNGDVTAINKFLEMCSTHYDKHYSSKLYDVSDYFMEMKGKEKNAKNLYRICFLKYRNSLYFKYYFKNLIKGLQGVKYLYYE